MGTCGGARVRMVSRELPRPGPRPTVGTGSGSGTTGVEWAPDRSRGRRRGGGAAPVPMGAHKRCPNAWLWGTRVAECEWRRVGCRALARAPPWVPDRGPARRLFAGKTGGGGPPIGVGGDEFEGAGKRGMGSGMTGVCGGAAARPPCAPTRDARTLGRSGVMRLLLWVYRSRVRAR